MDFLTLAKKRYSVRAYTEQKVEKEKLDAILEAAHVAPTGGNCQPQHLIVVQSDEGLNKIGKATNIYGAPLAIIVCSDTNKTWTRPFDGKKLTNASFYVYIASKIDPSMAPEGKDGLYILMPVSNAAESDYEWNEETVAYYRGYILNELKKIRGFENIENEIVVETHTTPLDFRSKFNAHNGATFGLQPILKQSNHYRPQSKASHCENLYFTGSSTHPGAGVPIVLLSAKIAAQELIQDDTGELFDYSVKSR